MSSPTALSSRAVRMPVALGLGMLPWLAVAFWTGGVATGICLAAYVLAALCAGYAVAAFALPRSRRVTSIVLAPALGIFTFAGSGALGLRSGLSVRGIFFLWLALAAVGTVALWRDRSSWIADVVPHGKSLIVLSAVICLIYFVPGAKNDSILRPDGSYNWIYVDTQHFYALASSIKSSVGAPRSPGTVTAELNYHFGPYVPAAAISCVTGLELGNALVRVTRAASLWALVLSTFGIGTILSLKATGERIGGMFSVVGLFFYGSIMSLFSNEANSASYVSGAILYKIPGIEVLADGGPFSHLVLGHSVLHGLVAITAVLGLCLIAGESGVDQAWRWVILLALPALAVPNNSVAALYILSSAGIILFWDRWRSLRSWAFVLVMLGLFFASWRMMGFNHSNDAAGAGIKHDMLAEWWTIVIWFTVGLGFRILSLQWISKSLRDRISILVAATLIELLCFTVTLNIGDGNERYGVYFLQAMLSIFAFSRVRASFWRVEVRRDWCASWFRLAAVGLAILAGIAIAARMALFLTHRHSGIHGFGKEVTGACVAAVLCFGIAVLMKRNLHIASVASAVMMCILAVGLLAWIAPWLDFGMGRMRMDIALSSGEVAGLHRLHELAALDQRFATNRHQFDSIAQRRERSYAYGAFSERPVLLEGYLDRGITQLPWFNSMLHDNDLMFTTNDSDTLHRIAKQYQVQWLVAQPGSDLVIARPLPSWLVEQQNTGTLKIYKVNE